MSLLKRNIGLLFTLVILSGLVLLCTILFYRWQTIVANEMASQTARAKLVAQSVDNLLLSQELLLDLVARELLNEDNMFAGQAQIPLLDNILAENPMLVGFGLARPDGTLVRVSSSLDASRLPNLLTNPSTRESFARSLESEAMVLGRTYAITNMEGAEPKETWVIPVRKAIRGQNGTVVGVMTAGIRLGEDWVFFGQPLHKGPEGSVWLYRETDGYVQYMSREGVGPEVYSQITIPEDERLFNEQAFEQALGMAIDDIEARNQVVVTQADREGGKYMTAKSFNSRYHLWIVSETRFIPLYKSFSSSIVLYSAIYLLFSLLFYRVFKLIDTAERKRHDELLYLTRHDDLTSLLNRNGLLSELENLIPDQTPFSLLLINIDNFKGINDRFGLESGDETLREFSRRLTELADDEEILARLGGDEFALVNQKTDLADVEKSFSDLIEKLTSDFEVGGLRLHLSASVGVAIFPAHGQSLGDLLRSAHLGLYEAKKSRNAFCVYRAEMKEAYLRRLAVEQRLRTGLEESTLFMMYQPQVNEHHKTVGLEALVRWNDPDLGPVSPAEFVDVAEKSGLMAPLGRYILETSIREFSRFQSDLNDPLDLAINISIIQFRQPDFVKSVMQLLEVNRLSPSVLVLEITETLLMTEFDQAQQTLERLRELGIRISLDDFGTGYSSLSLLRKLSLDELKIDKSFVDNVLDDDKAARMIRSIIAIAESHLIDVIAEGVELKEQAEALAAMGCRRFQGYYFSRPEMLGTLRNSIDSQQTTPSNGRP